MVQLPLANLAKDIHIPGKKSLKEESQHRAETKTLCGTYLILSWRLLESTDLEADKRNFSKRQEENRGWKKIVSQQQNITRIEYLEKRTDRCYSEVTYSQAVCPRAFNVW